jgi:DNA-binding HxlR family transcriptional regulator
MLGRTYEGQNCSLASTLELVGERWTLLIVRDALLGVTRFDAFLARLGIARNVLTDRLRSLVDNGILERVEYRQRPSRHEYRLTPAGRDLTPVIVTLTQWGDRHRPRPAGPPRLFEHADCGGPATAELTCGKCATPIPVDELTSVPGPGAANPPAS